MSRTRTRKPPQRATPPPAASFFTGTKRNAVLCLLLAGVTIALYSPVLGYDFVRGWDDGDYVTANAHVQDGLAFSTVEWAFTSTHAANWHPLTWLSHAFDCQLFALSPTGHHFDNVLIHALNAVVLFLLLVWVSRRTGPSLMVAALFALHPLNVESVAWISERKNVLSTLFFLLAIAAYLRYAQKPDWRRYLLVAVLFAAGLMAKPMVITLPFVLLLLDYWPLERIVFRRSFLAVGQDAPAENSGEKRSLSFLVLEKLPLLVLSAASAWITLKAQHDVVRTFDELSFAVRAKNAVVSYGLYLWKMLWPTHLAAFYPHPANALPLWQVMLSALVLLAVTALVLVSRHRRYLTVGWFWYLGTLIPVIGLVQVSEQAIADRYAYLPLIGIFIMIAWGLDDWAEARKIPMVWRVVPALCILTALGFVTSFQLGYWENDYTLWAHTVAVTDRNPYAHIALGNALMSPYVVLAGQDAAQLNTQQKRMEEARRQYEEAIESSGMMATALNNPGDGAGLRKQTEQARRNLYAEALNNLGVIAATRGDSRDAIAQWRAALAIVPGYSDALANLGHELLNVGQFDEAQSVLTKALELSPDRPNAQADLGALLAQRGQYEEARLHLEHSLALAPGDTRNENNLCVVLKRLGRPDEAAAHCKTAMRSGNSLPNSDSTSATH